ncbi:MAG: hypothetical protein E7653_03720 [Ruminococcaceae bacterium]|nr:hypothetical protein [Oscillospiraceae bacterium]
MNKQTKGISFLNPVRVEGEYLKKCAEYAIEHGIKHFELVGPTHDRVRGNCDGMMFYRKYSQFNDEKDAEYVEYCQKVVNEALDMVAAHGIKSYYWHHELEIPLRFDEVYPEIHNADGDVEVTHPLIKDFLENKIDDFFHAYPNMSGIVLTLHETRIPLLKLKNQKLDKVERVRYVTEILYNACKKNGKELIVRPFASLAKDYDDLMDAYERISSELLVCDKWTKYDWSLFRPANPFFARIKNPLIVETDIFGEYFGKGFLPLMLKDHIIKRVEYCNGYGVRGYVSRIDRDGYIPFGTPNEVNLEIMDAAVDGRDVDAAIDAFFTREYGEYGAVVKEAMSGTEQLQIKAMHAEGKILHWLSRFPTLPVMKNSYRMFRSDFELTQEQLADGFKYFRPEVVLRDKDEAIEAIEQKLALVKTLEGKLDADKYYSIYMRFANFCYVAKIFKELAKVYIACARYFEDNDESALPEIFTSIDKMTELDEAGYAELGKDWYCEVLAVKPNSAFMTYSLTVKYTERMSQVHYLKQMLGKAVELEVEARRALSELSPVDFVVAGGFGEGHNRKSEPNFSGALTLDDGNCRTAGSERGAAWSVLKTHGWFSYDMKVKQGVENTIVIRGKGHNGTFSIDLAIDGDTTRHSVTGDGIQEISRTFTPKNGAEKVTVRIDRNSDALPFVYSLMIVN